MEKKMEIALKIIQESNSNILFVNNPGTTSDVSDKFGHTKIISRYSDKNEY